MFVSAEGSEVNITPQARNNKNSHFQNEAKCKTFLVKMSLFA